MNKQDAIDHFGGVANLARALNIRSQSISQWGEKVPYLRAYQIEKLTGGKLRADNYHPR